MAGTVTIAGAPWTDFFRMASSKKSHPSSHLGCTARGDSRLPPPTPGPSSCAGKPPPPGGGHLRRRRRPRTSTQGNGSPRGKLRINRNPTVGKQFLANHFAKQKLVRFTTRQGRVASTLSHTNVALAPNRLLALNLSRPFIPSTVDSHRMRTHSRLSASHLSPKASQSESSQQWLDSEMKVFQELLVSWER